MRLYTTVFVAFATLLLVGSARVPIPWEDMTEEEIKGLKEYINYVENRNPQDEPDFVDILEIPTGWAATILCSGIFVAGIPEDKVLIDDVDAARYVTRNTVDYVAKSVTSVLRPNGTYPAKAIYREGVGCALVSGLTEEELRSQDLGDQSPRPPLDANVPWPLGEYVTPNIPESVDIVKLKQVVDEDFANPVFNTRAVIIVYRGQIVLEQYGNGIVSDNKLLGWSMTKSITSTIIGMLIEEGRLALDDPLGNDVPEWSGNGDERQNITLRNMLHMSSGLNWREESTMLPDCLFSAPVDCAAFAANKLLRTGINEEWNYSTGTTYILSRLITQKRLPSRFNNFEYYRGMLFDKLSINSAVIEFTPNGQYPGGGSFAYLTARDWARLGLLYMRNGLWVDNQQVISSEWAEYSCTPAPTTVGRIYGSHFWLGNYPTNDQCYMSGFRRQNVFLMKSKDLMVVRLAMPDLIRSAVWDENYFLGAVFSCFP